MLDGWLDYYRATLLHKCAGLTPEQLVARSCPPSPMSLVGLVRHLTEMEEDLKIFADHCARSREIMAGARLDQEFGRTRSYTLRWVYLYLIKEYARHLGHADLLRERVDGATGE